MKTQKKYWLITILVAAMLSLTTQAHALYTNFLDNIVGALITESNQLAGIPAPTSTEKKQLAEVKKALKDLSKPSYSVAGDYNLFFLAALHLGDLANDPMFATIGEDAFNAFLGEAQAEFGQASNRVAALNNFVPTKRAAAAQLVIAGNAFTTLQGTSNQIVALLLVKQVFTRVAKADVLAAKGEAHSGFALNSLDGFIIHYTSGAHAGTLDFENDTDVLLTNENGMDSGTYTYTRTGLNTGAVVINDVETGPNNATVKLTFTSATTGKFSFHEVKADNSVVNASGTFTVTH